MPPLGWTRRACSSGRLEFVIAVVSLFTLLPGQAALASSSYAPASAGIDVSYPLCNTLNLLTTTVDGVSSQFAVVGVTGGRAFTQNRCFAEEYQALSQQGLPVSFYFNLSAPRGQGAGSGQAGPQGTCASGDLACESYNFGWNAADYAYTFVQQTADSLGLPLIPSPWWLDVERANYWSPNTSLNDQVIQGAIDYLQATVSGSTPGIYSIDSNWRSIAGASYQPGVPEWLAGAKNWLGASALCDRRSFTGGPIALVQYATRTTDLNYAC
jgi:hypothetical protein